MFKKIIYFCLFVMLAGCTNAAGQELVGWWPLDDGAGTTAVDSSGTGNNGTVTGTATWVEGKVGGGLQLSGSNNYITASHIALDNRSFTIAMWIKPSVLSANHDLFAQGTAGTNTLLHIRLTGPNAQYTPANIVRFAFYNGDTDSPANLIQVDKWYHIACVFNINTMTRSIYINGEQVGQGAAASAFLGTTGDPQFGAGTMLGGEYFNGVLDDIRVYTSALSAEDIIAVMTGVKGLALNPQPSNGAKEIPIDVGGISWTPGEFVSTDGGTHNVFYGTDEASVTNATIAEPLGTTLYQGLDVNNIALDRLEYGTTYYWRVDEVNIPSKPGTSTGNVWNFTTELEGYPLEPAQIVNVTASENPVYPDEQEPNMTCNESGLDANDLHSTELATMWLGMADEPGQVWIQYEFDRVYKLHDMLVWNYNELPPGETYGAKDVNIAYSLDGVTWTALGNTVTFNQATGDETCTANTAVGFDGAIAKYVKLVFLNSFEDGLYTGGVSEVRFSAIPTRAAKPDPEDEDTGIAVDAVLGWKAGRDAAEHNLYIGTDVNAVTEGTASKAVLQDASYAPVLDLAKTYYWKVDEVNMAEEYTTWDGDVWSFSTVQTIVVDNFEVGYDDSDANAVWATWIDGYGNESVNGALMGYEFPGPYLSTTNINGGHSAPIRYNNTTAGYSEVKAQSEELPIGTVDWSLGSPKTLTIWFRGDPCNVVGDEELYCVVDGKRVVYGGDIAYLGRERWMQWDIDLSTLGVNLSDVDDIAIGIKKIGATGGSGVLLIDYIQLTGLDAKYAGKSIYFEAEGNMTLTGIWRDNETSVAGYSGTGFIDTPNTKPNITEPNLAGLATKAFTSDGGKYMVNIRYRPSYSGGWRNAIFVRIIDGSGNPAETDVTLQTANGWVNCDELAFINPYGWDTVYNRNGTVNQDVTWTLPAGNYTIQFSHKEAGVKLDVVEILKVSD